MKSGQTAYSLIELLLALAILGILLAVSYPSYQRHVLRSYRAEAMADLLLLANSLEQYRADNGSYSDNFTELGCLTLSESGRYEFTISLSEAGQAFVVTADALGVQRADTECGQFSLNQFGQRNTSGAYPVSCWH